MRKKQETLLSKWRITVKIELLNLKYCPNLWALLCSETSWTFKCYYFPSSQKCLLITKYVLVFHIHILVYAHISIFSKNNIIIRNIHTLRKKIINESDKHIFFFSFHFSRHTEQSIYFFSPPTMEVGTFIFFFKIFKKND